MKKKYWLASGLTTALLATAASGIYLTNRLMYIKPKDPAFILQREIESKNYDEQWFEKCSKTILSIDSKNGYKIKGYYLQPLKTNNTVIICHGVTENKISSIKYARLFERLGYNAIIYDHRRHGDSGGKTTSYGYYEKFDLQAVVNYTRNIIGENAILGIHGESMGAATMLLYAGSIEDIADFYVADCAYSNFRVLLQKIMKDTISINSPYTVTFANIFMRMRDGYSLKTVAPIDVVSNIEKPVLFVHSKPDAYIPFEMAEELYAAKKDAKEIHLFDIGAHAESYNEAPEQYEQVVKEFLEKYL